MRRSAKSSIVDELRRYDPMLRVRWSLELREWVVERKVPERVKAKFCTLPVKFVESQIPGLEPWVRVSVDSERYIQWRDGYVTVDTFDVLDRRVIHGVLSRDVWKFGNYGKRYKSYAQYQESRRQAELRRKEYEEIVDYSKQVYDDLSWASGRTSSNHMAFRKNEVNHGLQVGH